MASKAEKALILGIDSPIASRVYRFAEEGKLPTIKSLMNTGASPLIVWCPTPQSRRPTGRP
jgi:hypothetical protein